MEQNRKSTQPVEEINKYIIASIQNAVQSISEFLSTGNEITLKINCDIKHNFKMNTITAYSKSTPVPLNIVRLFSVKDEICEEIANQIRILMIACGYEILDNNESSWKIPKHLSSRIAELFECLSASTSLTVFTYAQSGEKRGLKITSGTKEALLISADEISERSIGVVERQVALLLASMNKTVQISDGSKLNVYGCVSSPFELEFKHE